MIKKKIFIFLIIPFFLTGCYLVTYSLAGIESSLAQKLFQASNYEKAKFYLRKVIELDRNGPFAERALYLLGKIYEKEKKYSKAIYFYKKVLSYPVHFNYYQLAQLSLARIYFKRGDIFLAEDYLKMLDDKKISSDILKEKLDLKKKIAEFYEKNPSWEKLKKLYQAYKKAYNQYLKLLLTPGINNSFPFEQVFELKRKFEEKKEQYEKELKKEKRKQALEKARQDYLKAFEKYREYLRKQGDIPDYEGKEFEKMFSELQQKYLIYQMLLYGISVELNGN